jgi:hypothetical protein
MAATVTAGDTSVTFTVLDGQVVTFSEYSNATFTFEITGTVTSDTPWDPAQSSPHGRMSVRLTESSEN